VLTPAAFVPQPAPSVPAAPPSAPAQAPANPFAGANPFAATPATAANRLPVRIRLPRRHPLRRPRLTQARLTQPRRPRTSRRLCLSRPPRDWASNRDGRERNRFLVLDGQERSRRESGRSRGGARLGHRGDDPWDSNVLHVSHLTPPRSFYVGEEFSDKSACDYFIPARPSGRRARRLWSLAGSGFARHPAAVTWVRDIPGKGGEPCDLVSSGRARPSSEMSGAYEYELPAGAKARMELEGSASSSR